MLGCFSVFGFYWLGLHPGHPGIISEPVGTINANTSGCHLDIISVNKRAGEVVAFKQIKSLTNNVEQCLTVRLPLQKQVT